MAPRAHRTVAVDLDAPAKREPRSLNWPWYLLASLGPVTVLVAVWVVLAALTSIGWLTSPDVGFGVAIRLAGDLLILAHGAPVTLGGQVVSITPLGLSLGIVFLGRPIAQFAARQAAAQVGTPDDNGKIWADPEAVVFRVGTTFTAVYTGGVLAVSVTLGAASFRTLIGGLVIGGIMAFWGACRGVDYDPTEAWPSWLRAVPRAMLLSGLLVLIAGAFAFAWALWAGRGRVAEIFNSLDGGVPALVLLIAVHLAYLPNIVLACCSWLLGAGVSVGDGSLITVVMTDVGVLPAIPVFGAIPEAGPAPASALWWLAAGVLAGAVAGLAIALARPRARFDQTAIAGGLAGMLAGLLIAVACSMGAGGLGTGRLAHIGARMPELAVFAPTILGLSGMAAGLVAGVIRRPWKEPAGDDTEPEDEPVDSGP